MLKAKPELLILSSNHQIPKDIINIAIENGTHLLKVPPAALDFTTCTELITSAAKHGVSFVTANICRFAPGFAALQKHLAQTPEDLGKHILNRGRWQVLD